ncbi:MAG: hypothetical protein LLG20_05860 [Acidobacteriales bacterium]|nr:hypothetical protein [Terriglobales bacterium]
MTELRHERLLRFFPSLTDVAFILPVLFLLGFGGNGLSRMLEGDTGWHVRAGDWMRLHGQVPTTDIFSFSKEGQPWCAYEWLSEIIFSWLHQWGGLAAVVLFSTFLLCLTFAWLFRLTRRKSGHEFIAIILTAMAIQCSSIHWWARPHLFTLLFIVIFYDLLERVKAGQTRLLIALPLITVFWTNVHAGFIPGVVLIGIYAADLWIQALVTGSGAERRELFRRSIPYLYSIAGCVVASLANPYGYKLHVHVLHTLTGGDSPLYRYISEWQSTNFHNPMTLLFQVMIVLGLFAALWKALHREFVYVLAIVGGMHMGLVAGRHIPIFFILATPLVAEGIVEGLHRLANADLAVWLRRVCSMVRESGSEYAAMDRVPRVYASSALAFALLVLIVYIPNPPRRFRAEYSPKSYPVAAVDFLKREGVEARGLFADDEWGDYLIYRLTPSVKVFVDGRVDFYGLTFTENWISAARGRYDWEEKLFRRYNIHTVLLSVNSSLSSTLKESRRWRVVYDDGVAIVFRAAGTRGFLGGALGAASSTVNLEQPNRRINS